MHKLFSVLIISMFLNVGIGYAETAVDRNVKNALIDISKYEKQFLGKSTASKPSLNRSLKLLKLTRQRLDGAADHAALSWQEADQRYSALVTHMNGLLSGQAQPASKPAVSTPITATSAPTQSTGKQMISHQRVQVKKLSRDIKSATDRVDKAGPKPFQDKAYLAKLDKSLNHYQQSMNKFSDFPKDPDVVEASKALTAYGNMINLGKDHSAKEIAALGDVQNRLASIEKSIRQIKIPQTPKQPFKKGELAQWITGLAQARNGAIQIYKPLPGIKKRAYLPNNRETVQAGGAYDMNDVDRLDRSLRSIVGQIDKDLPKFTMGLDVALKHLTDGLEFYKNMDPTDPDQQTNHFLAQGRADEVRKKLTQDAVFAGEAAHYAKILKHKNFEQRVAIENQVKSVSALYEVNYQKARQLIRLPEAATTDSDLVEIAEETLGNPKYDYVGDIKRMVINLEKTHRSKKTTQATIDNIDISLSGKVTATGTETTYFYEWEQFQVATVEPVEDKFYIFYSMLKQFTSGGPTTPLNKWIISSRHQSSEIPEENINLD